MEPSQPTKPPLTDRSESIAKLAKALATCQKSIPTVKKSGKNPHFNSKYATLDDIIEAIRQPMADAELSYMQLPVGQGSITTIVMHSSGEWIKSTISIQARDQSPQALGSVITYMRRYALSSMLGIAAEEDDDGNAASAKTAAAAAPARTTKPAAKAPAKPEPKKTSFESAKELVKSAKTVDTLLMLKDRIEKSKDFKDEQREELVKSISAKVDRLDSGTPAVEVPE